MLGISPGEKSLVTSTPGAAFGVCSKGPRPQDENLPVVKREELAPGWVVEDPIGAKALGPEAISAAHIASLARTEAKLVWLSYLGLGTSPAHVRYVVRRLRRILPEGTARLFATGARRTKRPRPSSCLKPQRRMPTQPLFPRRSSFA